MEYIITLFWVFLELCAVIIFADALLLRHTSRKQVAITFLVVWLISSICVMLNVNSTIRYISNFLLTLFLYSSCFKNTWQRRLLCSFLCWVFLSIIDIVVIYGFCGFLQINYADLVWKKLLYITLGTISKLAAIFLFYVFKRTREKDHSYEIRSKWILLTTVFPIVSMFSLGAIFYGYQNSVDLSIGACLFSFCIAVANVAILYLIRIMEKQSREEFEITLVSQQMDLQTKSITALEKSYRAQRNASHEFSHQMQTIGDLLVNSKFVEAQNYIQQILKTHTARTFAVNTHHPILDAILNHKYQLANEQGIDMSFKVNDLSAIKLSTNELVVLFSNLLDNALEACTKLSENKKIECQLELADTFYISIRNTTLPVTINDRRIDTTKTPRAEHGYGLPNICRILDKLNAEYVFDYKDGWFHFVVEIPL